MPGPVILEEGDSLILVHSGRTSVNIKPVEYHELKAVAHIPLALFVMLSFPPSKTSPPAAGSTLSTMGGDEECVRNSSQPALQGDQLERQKAIFNASFELLGRSPRQGSS